MKFNENRRNEWKIVEISRDARPKLLLSQLLSAIDKARLPNDPIHKTSNFLPREYYLKHETLEKKNTRLLRWYTYKLILILAFDCLRIANWVPYKAE